MVGRNERRFWDDRSLRSRAALPCDPARLIFDAYVPHLISGWEPDLHASTWRQVSAATDRCADLAQTTSTQAVASEWLLDRAESIASSTIEEIRPSARRVARAEAQISLFGQQPADLEMQALRNVAATQRAIDLATSGADLTVPELCDVHATLMGEQDPIAGQIRDRQNWVGSGALGSPLDARHVGPPSEFVDELLDDLVEFANDKEGTPIVRAAIAHAQFETIHPFPDGNGRTGRALIQYMYVRDEVMSGSALPVSSALMLNRERYFDALNGMRAVCASDDPERSKALQPWIGLLAQATDHACVLRRRLIEHVEALSQRWTNQARAAGIRPSSAAFQLLNVLPQHPVITAQSAAELLLIEPRTAQRAVARLASVGILEQRSAGRRNRVFECGDMMDAFTESAREQPAANLTLATPASEHAAIAARSAASGAIDDSGGLRGALTSSTRP